MHLFSPESLGACFHVLKYGFGGTYSSVRRYLAGLEAAHPQAATVLECAPGEAAQVDFGTGLEITDANTGEVFATWVFVMTLFTWAPYRGGPSSCISSSPAR